MGRAPLLVLVAFSGGGTRRPFHRQDPTNTKSVPRPPHLGGATQEFLVENHSSEGWDCFIYK